MLGKKTIKRKNAKTNSTFGPPKGHSLQEFFLNMLECYRLVFFCFL